MKEKQTKEQKSFWNNNHPMSPEKERLWEKYVPASGPTNKLEINTFLALNRLIYDAYNNGWGLNNYSGELNYLYHHGYCKDINMMDVVLGYYTKFDESGYFDSEVVRSIENLLAAEKEELFTEDNKPYDKGWALPYDEWDKLFPYDDDDFEEEW